MEASRPILTGLIEACHEVIVSCADHLGELDRAIGDGDHGINMKRGSQAVHAERERLAGLAPPEALEGIGMLLVTTIGGASGPLYGTLLIEMGRGLRAGTDYEALADSLPPAVAAVARRGRSRAGDKTLLDVLFAVERAVSRQSPPAEIAACAMAAADDTIAMKALRGRASFLGDRSIGHMDPGACSCALLTRTICRFLEETTTA